MAGCADHPATPADLRQRGMARVDVVNAATWNTLVPAGQVAEVVVSHVNSKLMCGSGGCPTSVEIPAGKGRLQVMCYLVMGGDAPALQGSAIYEGMFLAGHLYGIKPQSVTPDCRVGLDDLTPASP